MAKEYGKYLTVTAEKKTEEEARAYFNRISAEFGALFAKLGSKFEEVTAEEKLRILFDFFHYGEEDDYHYDAGLYAQRGTASRMPLHRLSGIPYRLFQNGRAIRQGTAIRRTEAEHSQNADNGIAAVFMPFRVQEVNENLYFFRKGMGFLVSFIKNIF